MDRRGSDEAQRERMERGSSLEVCVSRWNQQVQLSSSSYSSAVFPSGIVCELWVS